MENKKQVVIVEQQPTKKYGKLGAAVAAVTAYAVTAPAYAAGSLDAVAASLTGEIDGAKATLITLFTAAAVVLGLFVGWRYLRRGANSA